jgi:DNA invertase Pin-like site-specific DNA recombinase
MLVVGSSKRSEGGDMSTSSEQDLMDQWITTAARAAGYEEGFGVKGCDLSVPKKWWAASTRQSTEEQRSNNHIPEYLLTCAKEAKGLGVVVPREYIFYDVVTGEHLERPGLAKIRRELAPSGRIAGVLFPTLDRLSREPMHVAIFEFELDHVGVIYHYADVPSGSDPMYQMMRQNLAYAAKFVKLANRKNNSAGNVGRVLKGLVPAHRAPYGYRYVAQREIGADARVHIKSAWWEVDDLGPDGLPIEGSAAWIVAQIFS